MVTVKTNRTYNPCDECPYSYSRTGEESSTCKICEFTYFKDLRPKDGKWEKRTWVVFDSEKVGFRCSECNTTWDSPTKFCPNCGSKNTM